MPQPEVTASVRARLDEVLQRLPSLRGEHRVVEPLEGGLGNASFRVDTGDRVVVVRLPRSDGGLVTIDRAAEYTNSCRAAESGAAPEVVDHLPGEGVLVVAWVRGRTYAAEDLRDETSLRRVAEACRLLHAGPRFEGDVDVFAVQRRYLRLVHEHGLRLPDRYLEYMPAVERIRRALAPRAGASVPCHNDLVAANLVDDGERVWIIDYEYAGNNDACFEIGNLWAEAELDHEHLGSLVDAYYGGHHGDKVARARLFALMSRYGWTLWALLQAAASPVGFDARSWAGQQYERAVAEFEHPGFDSLLDRAAAR
jgi:thiamine kinase-like enzyme